MIAAGVHFSVAFVALFLCVIILLARISRGIKSLIFFTQLSIAADSLYNGLYYSEILRSYPGLIFANLPLIYFYILTFYIIIRKRLNPEIKFKPIYLLLLVPGVFRAVSIIPLMMSAPREKIRLLDIQYSQNLSCYSLPGDGNFYYMISWLLFFDGLIVYSILKTLKSHGGRISAFSKSILISTLWSTVITAAIVGLEGLAEFYQLVNVRHTLQFSTAFFGEIWFILFLVFPYLLQLGIVSPLNPEYSIKSYSKSNLTGLDLVELDKRLSEILLQKKAFLNEDLTLHRLAKEIGIGSKQLSEYLNSFKNQGFRQYIQSLRLNEAEKMLMEQPGIKIVHVAFESGFNSLSSFYRAFQNEKGTSPKEFQKKCKGQQEETIQENL